MFQKGSAAVFGATELSEAAKVLEHAVKVRAPASNALFMQKQSSDHHLTLLFRFRLEQNGDTDPKELRKMADTIETCFKAVVSPSQQLSSLEAPLADDTLSSNASAANPLVKQQDRKELAGAVM